MKIIDSHFHWWPRSIFEPLLKRDGFPKAVVNARGGYTYHGADGRRGTVASWKEWFDLDEQLGYMDSLGHDISVVCSIGPLSVYFSELPVEEGRDAALAWNEEMAWAQRRYPGRVWASAAIPLVDTKVAIDVLDDAVNRLGLMGVNLPGSVGKEGMIDDERLEPFYSRVEELGLPVFLHPTDAVFADLLQGYNDALHLSLGRVMEVSAAASRLILSGMLERHPGLAYRRRAALSVRPHGQEFQDRRSAEAGQSLSPPHVHRYGFAALGRDEVCDRIFRRGQRHVRHGLSLLGSGRLPEAARRDRDDAGGEAEDFPRQCNPHSRAEAVGRGGCLIPYYVSGHILFVIEHGPNGNRILSCSRPPGRAAGRSNAWIA